MRSFRKSTLLILGAALGISAVFAQTQDGKPENPKDPKAVAKEARAQNKKAIEDAKDEFELPIPLGQPQKTVNVPVRGKDGKKQMNWEIGVGTKLDADNFKLGKLRLETYKEDGKTVDMDMDLPDAMYNNKTKLITSQVAVKIVRGDLEIVGQNMSYHLKDQTGALGGGVKTILHDRGSLFSGNKSTTVEFQKPTTAPEAAGDLPAPAPTPEKAPIKEKK